MEHQGGVLGLVALEGGREGSVSHHALTEKRPRETQRGVSPERANWRRDLDSRLQKHISGVEAAKRAIPRWLAACADQDGLAGNLGAASLLLKSPTYCVPVPS